MIVYLCDENLLIAENSTIKRDTQYYVYENKTIIFNISIYRFNFNYDYSQFMIIAI